MGVGILIISHDGIGQALLNTANLIFDSCPLRTSVLPVYHDSEPVQLSEDAVAKIKDMDTGAGVLVLTDLYGSTPCNVAQAITTRCNVHTVAGINLSMLLRVFNYHKLTLAELTEKAVSGGKDGITQVVLEKKYHA